MLHITRALTVAAAVLAVLVPATQAEAEDACPSETFTPAEYEQVTVGMFKSKVFEIVGSRGVRDHEAYYAGHPDAMIRQWAYCGGGLVDQRQGITFDRSPEGRWVVLEVG